mgnify:CR=1 FL=1
MAHPNRALQHRSPLGSYIFRCEIRQELTHALFDPENNLINRKKTMMVFNRNFLQKILTGTQNVYSLLD